MTDSELLITAQRVANFGRSLQDAHALGHGPGSFDDISTRQFHDEAVKVNAETLPWSYMLAIADRFLTAARQLTARAVPLAVVDEWILVIDFLRSAGASMSSAAPDPPPEPNDLGVLTSTVSVMPFDRLAALVSERGARSLAEAGDAVASVLALDVERSPLSEHETALLNQLIAGRRIIEVAEQHGYAERTLHRKLNEIWERLGAKSRVDGLALAVAKGWIDPPNGGQIAGEAGHDKPD